MELGWSRGTSSVLNNLPQNICVFVLDRFWELVHSGAPETAGWAVEGEEGAGVREERRGAILSLFAARENATLHHAGKKKGKVFPQMRFLLLILCLSDGVGKSHTHTHSCLGLLLCLSVLRSIQTD